MPDHVARLVAANSGVVQKVVAKGVGREVHWVSRSGHGQKRIRLNRKAPAHLAGLVIQSRSRVWKRRRLSDIFLISFLMGMLLLRAGLGWDNSWVLCWPTSPGLHVLN